MLIPITCPTCEAAYRVPAESLGDGRKVRCRRCLGEWFATAGTTAAIEAEPDAEPEIEAEAFVGARPQPILGLDEASGIDVFDAPEPSAPRAVDVVSRPARAPRLRGRFGGLIGSRTAKPRRPKVAQRPRPSAIVVAAGVAALGVLIGGRVEIVRAAPALASLYDAVGLPVNVRGLEIRDVRSAEEVADGAPLLVVTGLVENVSKAPLDVPRLRLAVTAQGEREIYAWTTVAARPKLEPGETATFRARLASPPAEGQAITVRFLAKRDLTAAPGR